MSFAGLLHLSICRKSGTLCFNRECNRNLSATFGRLICQHLRAIITVNDYKSPTKPLPILAYQVSWKFHLFSFKIKGEKNPGKSHSTIEPFTYKIWMIILHVYRENDKFGGESRISCLQLTRHRSAVRREEGSAPSSVARIPATPKHGRGRISLFLREKEEDIDVDSTLGNRCAARYISIHAHIYIVSMLSTVPVTCIMRYMRRNTLILPEYDEV